MKRIALALLIILLLNPQTLGSDIKRTELDGNITLITTNTSVNHYLLGLINENKNFNVTLVKNIPLNLTFDIDPSSIIAMDNYNTNVSYEVIGPRNLLFTYNNTLPRWGYGKIFVDVMRKPIIPPTSAAPEEKPVETIPPPTPDPTPQPSKPPIKNQPIQTQPPTPTSSPSFNVTENKVQDLSNESSMESLSEVEEESSTSIQKLFLLFFLTLLLIIALISVLKTKRK
jgi:hypothetical protein